eukprot:CAMPEP_0174868020 /NCGR_PEP_ID=MMETSP1114-20130205/65234_1 /TAXON_ID=312471 /ORGANISM="Neobodo designis, Strain CCAP 1951/1" /LENGTH=88 /DNA_ID=CAMNT_0016103227 /DNA_START=37 /DNA_END=299 /DNA_ORIENTATION=-
MSPTSRSCPVAASRPSGRRRSAKVWYSPVVRTRILVVSPESSMMRKDTYCTLLPRLTAAATERKASSGASEPLFRLLAMGGRFAGVRT